MELEHVIQDKQQTEALVEKLINDFIERTGLPVEEITLSRDENSLSLNVKITLTVRL